MKRFLLFLCVTLLFLGVCDNIPNPESADSGTAPRTIGENEAAGSRAVSYADAVPVTGVTGLQGAPDWVSANAVEGGTCLYALEKNEFLEKQEIVYPGKAVTLVLKSSGKTLAIAPSGTGSLFSVKGDKTGYSSGKTTRLILEDIKPPVYPRTPQPWFRSGSTGPCSLTMGP
jgi:hypothetical protein